MVRHELGDLAAFAVVAQDLNNCTGPGAANRTL